MNITSFGFLCFFAAALLCYYLLPCRVQWPFLLCVSVVWLLAASGGQWYVCLYPAAAVAAVWLSAQVIVRSGRPQTKRWAILLAAGGCLLLLCVLKFWSLPLAAPAGISFYTLTLLGYLFDVSYGLCQPEKNYLKLLLFGCYFPTMVSGPIVRYREMAGQLYQGHPFDYRQVAFGMQRMLWGFFKKLVVSERMAVVADAVFDQYGSFRGLPIWIGAVAFTFQLYMDFSGCMDIVLGISQCFGILLPENFNAPFLATSISEYWRRWHITLGAWLREYLFYPLLRSRFFTALQERLRGRLGKKGAKQATTFLAMFLLWFAIGYWHGGAVHFIIGCGLLHWFYIVSGELAAPFFSRIREKLGIRKDSGWYVFLARVRTFFLVTLGLVFFRSPTATDAVRMVGRGMTGWRLSSLSDGTLAVLGLDWVEGGIAVLSLLFVSWVTVRAQKGSMRERLERLPLPVRWAVLYALLFSVILLGKYGPDYSPAEFIYQNFQV